MIFGTPTSTTNSFLKRNKFFPTRRAVSTRISRGGVIYGSRVSNSEAEPRSLDA